MRRYLLDTGILVHYIRKSLLYQDIEATEGLSRPEVLPIISVVTYAELLSFGMQQGWGEKRKQSMQDLLAKLTIIDINSGDPDLLNAYAEMDAYSKGKLLHIPLGRPAVKMGKNDLWIAATAKVANAVLLTIDSDFDHLNGTFIQVKKYQQQ